MNPSDLSATVAVLLAVSLATERLVAILKTLAPAWLAEKPAEAAEVDPAADKGRRLRVQAIALICAWVTAAFLVEGGWDPLGTVALGRMDAPVWLVGLLASGGSAFWAQLVGWTGALKDLRRQQSVVEALTVTREVRARAERLVDPGTELR